MLRCLDNNEIISQINSCIFNKKSISIPLLVCDGTGLRLSTFSLNQFKVCFKQQESNFGSSKVHSKKANCLKEKLQWNRSQLFYWVRLTPAGFFFLCSHAWERKNTSQDSTTIYANTCDQELQSYLESNMSGHSCWKCTEQDTNIFQLYIWGLRVGE